MSRFVQCDACKRVAYRVSGRARGFRTRLQRYRARYGEGGEWVSVVRTLDGGGFVCLDACCEGCEEDLRHRVLKVSDEPRKEATQ